MFHLLGFFIKCLRKIEKSFWVDLILASLLIYRVTKQSFKSPVFDNEEHIPKLYITASQKNFPNFFPDYKSIYLLVEDILKDASQLLLSCIKKRRRRRRRRTKSEHTPSRNHVIKTCVSTIWLLSKTTFKSPCCRKNTGQHGFKKVRGEECARRFSDQSQT